MGNVFDEYYNGNLNEKYFKEIDKYLLTYSDDIKTVLNETIKQVKMKDIAKLQEELKQLNIP